MKRGLDKVIGGLAMMALLLACLTVGLRYLAPQWVFDWSDEVVVMLLVWAMMLSGYHLTLERSHVAVDLLTHGRPAHVRRRFEIAGTLGLLVFAGFMAIAGAWMTIQAYGIGEHTESTARISTWIYYACLPTGMALTTMAAAFVLLNRAGPPADHLESEIEAGGVE